MPDWLQQIDNQLFIFINQALARPWLDPFMSTVSNLSNIEAFKYGVLPAFCVAWIIWHGKKALRTLLALLLVGVLSDNISYRVFKSTIQRPRPNHVAELNSIVRLPHNPKSYSFPSNHSLSSFALATVASYYYPGLKIWFFFWAALTAFSRVYVGVHFVTDILAGALLGWGIAMLFRAYMLSRIPWWRSDEDTLRAVRDARK